MPGDLGAISALLEEKIFIMMPILFRLPSLYLLKKKTFYFTAR